jgi:hypothetical protein
VSATASTLATRVDFCVFNKKILAKNISPGAQLRFGSCPRRWRLRWDVLGQVLQLTAEEMT